MASKFIVLCRHLTMDDVLQVKYRQTSTSSLLKSEMSVYCLGRWPLPISKT